MDYEETPFGTTIGLAKAINDFYGQTCPDCKRLGSRVLVLEHALEELSTHFDETSQIGEIIKLALEEGKCT